MKKRSVQTPDDQSFTSFSSLTSDPQSLTPRFLPHINTLLDDLRAQIQATLGEKFVGLYLHGSLVMGDYDDRVSDVDLLVAMTSEMDDAEFAALGQMHDDIVMKEPRWDNRIEIAYMSLHALKTFRTERSPIGIISPGEPFHIKDAGIDWLMNWYMVREIGITLAGMPPETVIDPISKAEFVESIRQHVRDWQLWLANMGSRPSQAYAILTMCRSLYTLEMGEQISKPKAAAWTAQKFPQWASLIESALVWRIHWRESVDDAATLPETRRFIHFVIDRLDR